MTRAAGCGCLVLLSLLAGCTKDEDYIEVVRQQRANWKEMTDSLATIKDEKTMADAKIALDERRPKYDALARKANALPKPPPAAVSERLRDELPVLQATAKRFARESERVSKLPGGEEFMKQLESNSPGLGAAVQK